MKKKLYVSQIAEPYAQQNFMTIGEIFNGSPFLKGEWRFLEFQVKTTGATTLVPHNLRFTPKDAILLSQNQGTLSFNYSLFDSTYINLNVVVTTTPATFRVIIGRYTEEAIYV